MQLRFKIIVKGLFHNASYVIKMIALYTTLSVKESKGKTMCSVLHSIYEE